MAFTTKDWKDYPDTSTPITAAALEDLETRVTDYGNTYVTTSLPGSPMDGQEVYFAADATNGVIWHFRYRTAASKWEFVGGPPMYAKATGTAAATTTGAWTSFSSNAPSISIPLAGDYVITFGATAYTASNGQGTNLAPKATGLAASTDYSTFVQQSDSANNIAMSMSRAVTATGISGTLELQYSHGVAWTYERRWVSLLPIRI